MRALSSATCAAVVLAAGALLAPAALADAPGDNGDVKIHKSTTAQSDQRNEPKVCTFYLDAFNFDGLQSVGWHIDVQPSHGADDHAAAGTITLGADGNGRTEDMTLPDGQYKLYWNFDGENGNAKQKVFKVDCSDQGGTSTPTVSDTATAPGSSSSGGGSSDGGSSSGGSTGTPGTSGDATTPAASPSASSGSGSLASTGASVGGITALAVLLLGAGVFVRFRRKGAARQH